MEIVLFSPLISWRKQVFRVLFGFAGRENDQQMTASLD